jgi:hypothetical protein
MNKKLILGVGTFLLTLVTFYGHELPLIPYLMQPMMWVTQTVVEQLLPVYGFATPILLLILVLTTLNSFVLMKLGLAAFNLYKKYKK